MKKGFIVIFAALLLALFIPNIAEAKPVDYVRFTPCIAADGTYKLTIAIGYPGLGPTVNSSVSNGAYASSARIRKNGGAWFYYNYGKNGLTLKYGKLPAGTKYEVELLEPNGYDVFTTAQILLVKVYSITLEGAEIPPCFIACTGEKLFKMYLLTRPDSYCLLVSDVHPSVESQKTLCFPGTDWVATNTACEGWVCNNNCWECDYLGFERLTLKDLRNIHNRRMGLTQ
jgi:hypothetical protein